MSEFHKAGHCTLCEKPCYEVLQVWMEGERYPGEPKRLGRPFDGVIRVTFMLMDGTKADMTFCAGCAASLGGEHYTDIWRKVMRSWAREMEKANPGDEKPDWYKQQFKNGILAVMGKKPVKETANG